MERVQSRYQQVVFRDLYAMKFDPLLKESERRASDITQVPEDARHELELAQQADVIVFVYPLWFGTPPAIVKGYVDRVFGAASGSRDFYSTNERAFSGKRLAVISTSGASLPWLEGQGVYMSLRQSFDQYLKAVVGFSESVHYHADGIEDGLGPIHAARVFYEVAEFADKICAALAFRQAKPSSAS